MKGLDKRMDIYTALCSKKDSDIAETYMTIKQTDSALALLVRPDDVSDNKEANAKFSKKEADYQQVHNEKRYFEAALGSLAGDLRKQAELRYIENLGRNAICLRLNISTSTYQNHRKQILSQLIKIYKIKEM